MANRTLKIQITTAGSTVGPFSIYHTSISAPNLLETGVTRQQLVDGYYIDVDTLYNVLYIKSTGKCSTEDSFVYSIVPTPAPTAAPTAAPVTPAPTPEPTAAPVTPSPTAAPIAPPSTEPTPAPVTPAPATPAPVTPAPTASPTASPTAAPVTPAPITPSPTAAPATPAPVTPSPVYPAPTVQFNAKLHVLQGGYQGGFIYYTSGAGQYLSLSVGAYQNVTICAVEGSISQAYGSVTWYSYGVTCYN